MNTAVAWLVLFIVVMGTALLCLWVAALVDVVQARDMDETARLCLALLLIFIAPVGMIVWVVVRRSLWRTALVVTLGLGLGLTTAVVAALAVDRTPQHTITVSSQAGSSISVPAQPPASAP